MMRRYLSFALILCSFCQGCVLVQVQKKDHVLSRVEAGTQNRESHKIAAALQTIEMVSQSYRLTFTVRKKSAQSEQKTFHEKVHTENRLTGDGKSLRFFAGWLAFAYEDEGWGSYFLNLLGGIPLTLGLNLPIAVGDWISLPFRLGDEVHERSVNQTKVMAQAEDQADCPLFVVRIDQVDYALDAACTMKIETAVFREMAARHAYPPKFSGSFRYELIDGARREIQMNSLILLREFPLHGARIEFIERP